MLRQQSSTNSATSRDPEIEVPAARLDRREIEQCGDHAEHVQSKSG